MFETYLDNIIEVREFPENEQPFDCLVNGQYIGDFDTVNEAIAAAKWHIKHML